MKVADTKELECAVTSDLETIKQAVCRLFREEYGAQCGENNAMADLTFLFDGIMTLNDFTEFVYFKYFIGQFGYVEPKCSLYRHLMNFQKLHSYDYMDKEYKGMNPDEVSRFFNSPLMKSPQTASRRLYTRLTPMAAAKKLPESPDFETKEWEALRKVIEYEADSLVAQRHGMEMGKMAFYQLVTYAELKTHNREIPMFMASDRTRRADYIGFYMNLFNHIDKWMMDTHNAEDLVSTPSMAEVCNQIKTQFLAEHKCSCGKDFDNICQQKYKEMRQEREDTQTTYIARAINLFELEKNMRFLLVLDFAILLAAEDKSYFENISLEKRFWLSNLPPHFFYQIPPENEDLTFPDKRLKSMFQFVSHDIGSHKGTRFQVPVLNYNAYSKFFLFAGEQDRKLEEFRYYIQIYLARIMIHSLIMKKHPLSIPTKNLYGL